nr:MAG TPA: hypothetical protein [Caudoviricetes sp.]
MVTKTLGVTRLPPSQAPSTRHRLSKVHYVVSLLMPNVMPLHSYRKMVCLRIPMMLITMV